MASNDAARHGLYARLEHVLGNDHADTLMAYLPRDRADEVASKSDIARLEERLNTRFDAIDARFDQMDARFDRMEGRTEARFDRMDDRIDRMDDRMDQMQRFYVGAMVGSMTALTAIFSLVVAFLG
jgi:hypothetical protein